MKTNVVAIFGYNNTRLYDVKKIKDILKHRHQAELLLVKESLTEDDRNVSQFCLDHSPEDAFIAPILERYLEAHHLSLRGCLPFSDKGVIGAAHAARHFGVFGDDPATAQAMLDKSMFRALEASPEFVVPDYKKPFFTTVYDENALRQAVAEHAPLFIKPVAEGNSRGCMKVSSNADLDRWLADYRASLPVGVICEEYLAADHEYSFDGTAGKYWITKKFTTSGSYRAEYQHVVPAPLEENVRAKVEGSLAAILRQIGSRGGAIHHEFFILGENTVASVEPNRRPAGMMIWDLASWVFDDFDPWEAWIDACLGVDGPVSALKPSGFAGIRGVISRQSGTMMSVAHELIEDELKAHFSDENVKFKFLKEPGSLVRAEPRDNADFLAYVAVRAQTYEELVASLAHAETICLRHVEVVS